MNVRLLLGLVAACCLVSVVASEAPRIVMGKGVIPRQQEWKFIGLPNHSSQVVFNIALKQQNIDLLEATLYAVSDPKSERYGKYLSIEQILDIVAPPKEDHDYVVAWLLNNGILKSEIKSLRDAIKVTTTVASAEALLQTKFVMYQSKLSGLQRTVVEEEFSVPLDIDNLIDMITGITEFPYRISRKVQDKSNENSIDEPEYWSSPDMIVPETIKTLYNFTEAESTIDNADASQGVVEFLGYGSFVESDLTHFFKGVGYPFDKTAIIVGPYYPNGFLESELDIQYIMGVARNATSFYWTVEGWMYDFALDAFVDSNIPLVFSMSYAWTESSQCDLGGTHIDNCTTSSTYVNRTSIEFMKLGTRGVTLLAASGDQGAPGDANTDCSAVFKHLYPLFPAASPYVLSVGATMLVNETPLSGDIPVCKTHTCTSGGEEITCMYPTALITSGGGFSDYAVRPSYQDSAVQAYFANTTTKFPPSSQFNKNNRGYPDVAGLGHSYLIVDEGTWEIVDGTSCSTPMWGAIITVLNNIRLNQNKSPLGFVNPLLYQIAAEDAAAFQDITLGNNKCTEYACCKEGYLAAPGWDAVTGLGTPNVGRLIDYVKNMAN